MTKLHFMESGSILDNVEGKGRLVRIISEGQGSSGYYTRELLEQYAEVFSDSLSFMDHPADPSKPHLRSSNDIAGEIVGKTWYEERDGVAGIYGYYDPRPEKADFLERYGKKLGLSVFIAGEGRKDNSGKLIVESFDGADPYKSVDVVVAAGRGGRFEEHLKDPAAASVQENTRKETMELEDLAKDVKALTAVIEGLVDAQAAKATVELTAEASQKIAESAVTNYAGAAEAIAQAKLFKFQSDALLAEAKTGADITQAIEAAKVAAESIRAELGNSQEQNSQEDNAPVVQGTVHEAARTNDTLIEGWS